MRFIGPARAIALAAGFACFSCATLFQGTTEEIMVATEPAGAHVSTNDGRSGTTPYSLHANRSDDVQFHITKDGYMPMDISDNSHVQWGYVVSDIFFTVLIGLAVDGLDGAMFYHNQTMVAAHLDPLPSTAAPTSLPQAPTPTPSASSM